MTGISNISHCKKCKLLLKYKKRQKSACMLLGRDRRGRIWTIFLKSAYGCWTAAIHFCSFRGKLLYKIPRAYTKETGKQRKEEEALEEEIEAPGGYLAQNHESLPVKSDLTADRPASLHNLSFTTERNCCSIWMKK